MVTCYLYFFVFSFVFAGLFISRCLIWRSGRANVSSAEWFLASFFHYSLWFWKSNLHFSVDFWLTCAPQPRSSSSSAPAAASFGCVGCRWSARGSHAPRSSALWCTWGPRSSFFQAVLGGNSYTAADLRLGGPSDGACSSRTAVPHLGLFSHCRQFVFGVFYLCFLYFSLVSLVSACLCFDQILWEYLLANC
jgi:hypothetical protein